MYWTDWKPHYEWIVEQLGLNSNDDRKATSILSSLLEGTDFKLVLKNLENEIVGKDVIVCGAGPSLGVTLDNLKDRSELEHRYIVAADGAVTALIERNIQCDLLVTDLDGKFEDIYNASQSGTITIVHGHGDNIPLLEKYVVKLGNVLGSTQVEPLHNVFLWGGFTDGDRAAYIVSHYNPKRIILIGMDFGEIVGRWSKPGHSEHCQGSSRKLMKLTIAEKLLKELSLTTNLLYIRKVGESLVQK